jgi:hypothetical protein
MKKTEAYQVLSDLIFRGFITVDATIDGRHMLLKTVNNKEFDMIKFRAGSDKGSNYIARFNTFFLAYSIFMMDGYNMLQNREDNIRTLQEFFYRMPHKFYEKMIDETSLIRNKSYDSLKFLEGFSYTDSSRWRWKTVGGASPNDTVITGISGTSELGINTHQENWVYINRAVDDFDSNNREFELAILVASASNPKGAKQIRGRHDGTIQNVNDRRKKLAQIGYIDYDAKWTTEGWAAPVDTAEELVAELERQMSGLKDRHDIFMENYLNSMKEQAEARARQAEERFKRISEGDEQGFITGSQRPLTPKEAKELFSQPKKPQVVSVQSEEQVDIEGKERFISKIGSKVLTGKK